MNIRQPESRWFRWNSQWFYSWPIKILIGCDEHAWRTIGVVTWAGSLFYRWKKCDKWECLQGAQMYWDWTASVEARRMEKENGNTNDPQLDSHPQR